MSTLPDVMTMLVSVRVNGRSLQLRLDTRATRTLPITPDMLL